MKYGKSDAVQFLDKKSKLLAATLSLEMPTLENQPQCYREVCGGSPCREGAESEALNPS